MHPTPATTNPLLSAWRDGQTTFGLWGTLGGVFVAELAADEGVDYLCIDRQHGMMAESDVAPMLAALEARRVPAVVRVPENQSWMIMQVLDAGADGVIIPMVGSAQEAAAAVAACRYPPHGLRSYGPSRASIARKSDEPDVLADVACIVMIETAAGLQNLAEIVTTPGIDVIYVGPSDLAISMGFTPKRAHEEPRHEEAIAHILDTCRQHGVTAGIQCPDGATARRRAEQGFQMVSAGGDAAAFRRGLRSELTAARAFHAAAER